MRYLAIPRFPSSEKKERKLQAGVCRGEVEAVQVVVGVVYVLSNVVAAAVAFRAERTISPRRSIGGVLLVDVIVSANLKESLLFHLRNPDTALFPDVAVITDVLSIISGDNCMDVNGGRALIRNVADK